MPRIRAGARRRCRRPQSAGHRNRIYPALASRSTRTSPGSARMNKRNLLIIEDDPGLQSQMRWCFEGSAIALNVAGTEQDAIAAVRRHTPQVITLDLGLPPDPGGSTVGFRILKEERDLTPDCKV